MAEYLEEGFSITKLKTELGNKKSEFYFAETEGNTVKYLKVNTGNLKQILKIKTP